MEKMRLGRTGLEVSRIGFGGIPIQRLGEEEAVRVVQHCMDVGVTFLDTANGYTTSEERIGKAIASRRSEVIIATKTGARDRTGAREHLELSLRRLNTDYIDLWQFHGVSSEEDYARVLGPGGAMEAARDALRDGKIRHIGITSHSLDIALKAVPSGHFETLQFPFNYVTSEPADELIPLSRRCDVGFIAMKPLAGGLLEDATLAFKYLLQFDGIIPDPGIERPEEIDEIVKIVRGSWEFSAEERQELEHSRERLGTRFCRRCGYCQPCPESISIPTVLNIRSFYKRFSEERFFSGHPAEAVDIARECAECGKCEEQCPYKLPIREMLVECVDFFDSVAT